LTILYCGCASIAKSYKYYVKTDLIRLGGKMSDPKTNTVQKPVDPGIFRKKNLGKILSNLNKGEHQLKKTLGAFDLTVLGIGAIIGAGIFTLIGTAAAGSAGRPGAGPALIVSFVISGIICAITALCYAEFASMIPVAGSAYTYTYTTLGEIVAWMVGWVLVLGYAISSVAVACGWSGYLGQMCKGFGLDITFLQNFTIPGIPVVINIPAIFIILVATYLLYVGIQESARAAAIMVLVKLVVIVGFILIGAFYIKPENWHPFMPNGWSSAFMGAFLVFFAYMGFDMVATTAEETKNPERDLPMGIIISLAVCTVIYILVAGILTGMVPMAKIDVHAPIAAAMSSVGINWAAGLISVGAVAGLSSVILVQIMAVSRIMFAMSRDGLILSVFSKIHPKFHTPHVITVVVGTLIALTAIFVDINKAAELCNVGTLTAFTVVCAGVVVLRFIEPDRRRPFSVPFSPYLPALGALMSLALVIYTLFQLTSALYFYIIWLSLGFLVYFLHGNKHSALKAELKEESELSE
jgi:APA family basic amino acid/polyamine antiporter